MDRTILIVEDEADLADACVRLLNRQGWQAVVVATRAAGLGALARRPALVIVDRQLPDGDGLDVLEAAARAGTPAIMMSGQAHPDTRRLALETGAAAFLGKPFAVQALLGLVGDILGTPAATPPLAPDAPRGGGA